MGFDYQPELMDWQQVFGNDNPVVLEIVFGMGESLVEMKKTHLRKISSALNYTALVSVLVWLRRVKRVSLTCV